MVGIRRVGYFLSLTILVLGVLAIPLGVIVAIGGFFGSLDDGDTSTFGEGVAFIVAGILMFIFGLILSIVLKKSGNDGINLVVSESDVRNILNQNNDPRLRQDTSVPLTKGNMREMRRLQDRKAAPVEDHTPHDDSEGVEFADMVQDLLEANVGDTARIKYIAKRLDDKRSIYKSDRMYIERRFREFRNGITRGEI